MSWKEYIFGTGSKMSSVDLTSKPDKIPKPTAELSWCMANPENKATCFQPFGEPDSNGQYSITKMEIRYDKLSVNCSNAGNFSLSQFIIPSGTLVCEFKEEPK